jgi:hypothetical protein
VNIIRPVISELDVRTPTLPDDPACGSHVEDHPAPAGQKVEPRKLRNSIATSVTFSDGDRLGFGSTVVTSDEIENFRDAQHGVVVGNHQPLPVLGLGRVPEMSENRFGLATMAFLST